MMQSTTASGGWKQTPPAIFPPILGLFGLGLGWRLATDVVGAPDALSEFILGCVSLLFLFTIGAYLAKFLHRPRVLGEDLRILPGRAGVSAASGAAMLLAATIVPYSVCAAKVVLFVALTAHAVVATVIVYVLLRLPLPQRRVTAVWHITFVGFIISALAAVPLGATAFSEIVLFVTIALALTIWIGHLVVAFPTGVPAPLRPSLTIHLAPFCLIGLVGASLGYETMAKVSGWLALAGMAVILIRVPYLTAAGFSPFWGAFTFPLAAFANLMLTLSSVSPIFHYAGLVALMVASIAIPVITYRILKLWVTGKLAAITNAAHA